ncbi:hypothetical protein [Dongia deserti]|uniref:hypothetical protein n=1 Tax=Dongia deserti TaxID=2268030 RepID=UPI0013C4B4A4|nr:hypothetical protein [Dongia deserti]
MIDGIGLSQSLAGLLEAGSPEADDWDTSALADWPKIAFTTATPISSAELLAADFDQAR